MLKRTIYRSVGRMWDSPIGEFLFLEGQEHPRHNPIEKDHDKSGDLGW